jgi:hypothetical protein
MRITFTLMIASVLLAGYAANPQMADFKITYPGFGAAIHALNERAKAWLDECADGIPIGDGVMVEMGYLPHVMEVARIEGFVVAEDE